ncbi:TetR/AcrR family transcriptional regulator [Amycolatopsis taiwanensis]|uniref:TetR family transcriptional regulator n=1 Tax=Amycolatopsis taiwanensis TaxID=342230 RepID=A0A9W6R1P5_9PSEU|nr:TetR/AcrR family transcriptional regulator [Amycolatopsis taiwanensis]GLY65967.1 TetR family transcriptional regulator [Amycolatopsis taiwanensis]
MPRLTRAESQAHTRGRLIATATELFLRDGYSGTSLDKVAEAAGYSKGAVYSNFRNKDELCLAVLERIRSSKDAAMIESLAAADGPEALLDAFTSWWESTAEDEPWVVLETEYLAHARRDPELRREVAARNARIRRAMTTLLTEHLERCDIKLPLPAETVATALSGMSVGLGLLRSVDDQLDLGALPALVEVLVTAGRADAARHSAAGRH